MKTNASHITTNEQTCDRIQLSISDAIDANEKLNSTDSAHIQSCTECAKFHQLWKTESPLSTIASGTLLQQQNLTAPIISQLEKGQQITPQKEGNIIRNKFFKLASIAAVIAIVSTFSFQTILQKRDKNNTSTDITKTTTAKDELNIKLPKLELTLTEASIEQSLQENYQKASEVASDKWKTATTSISRATEYIATGTHYISTKYLPSQNDGTSGPQTQSTPQQDETNHLQYG